MILRSVWHYRRTHFVVALAVVISTAVIGGALIVGDSVRYSLQTMTLQRLGQITHALTSHRFFRESLAEEIQQQLISTDPQQTVLPAILLTGSVEITAGDQQRRAGSVTLLGVSDQSWKLLLTGDAEAPGERGIVLGHRTAAELQAKAGDQISVWIERPSSIPRDSLLGEREDVNLEIVLTVEAVLSETDGASRFSFNPAQQLPYNAFLSLNTLQERLGLEQVEFSPRNPIARPARVNSILVGTLRQYDQQNDSGTHTSINLQRIGEEDLSINESLAAALKSNIALEDTGLRLRRIQSRGYLSVESDSMILEDTLADAVLKAAQTIGMEAVPTLVYLINEMRAAAASDPDRRYSMYSIVAGMPYQSSRPLGPFLFEDGNVVPNLRNDEIILSDWLRQDLDVAVGDQVDARWHEVGSHGDLPETRRRFTVRGILKADDPISIDQDLTPFVDGVTNVNSFSDWDQPFEMEMDRITSRDDDYWEDRRATPKAFVSLETAEELWSSRFGRYTSIRVASQNPAPDEDQLNLLHDRIASEIRNELNPPKLGLAFQPVRFEGLRAATGANNFTVLFLGFSFFLILSAILLASLMFRLGIQLRIAQIGLLKALGFTTMRARSIFMAEGILVATIGTALGSLAAVYSAKFLIYALTHWWAGAVGTQFLLLDIRPASLLLAAAISLVMAILVIWLALRAYTHQSPRELLTGVISEDFPADGLAAWRSKLSGFVFLISIMAAMGLPALLIAEKIPSDEAFWGMSWRVVCFFVAGFSWLSTGLLILGRQLNRRRGETIRDGISGGLWRLAIANAARSPQRSLLTAALIACATFIIVAVGAGRRNPVSEIPDLRSGNGGFSLVAESSQPILFDLNSTEGRRKLNFGRNASTSLPEGTRIFSFAMKPGQDASCLNLYRTTVPTLLGAAPEFIRRGGFRFADTPGENPWNRLNQDLQDHNGLPAFPVIGDMNTLQFSLKKGLGDVILLPNETNPEFALKIVGMLDSSVFQGVLVMSEGNLKRVAPEVSGARYFLIETPAGAPAARQVAQVLETTLNAFGVDTEPVSQRLADFLAVQNTYLSTFQMLGGLGLIVGTFGLAAVMMRNVIERRSEIALLKAIGFTTRRVIRLILIENTVLLLWGMFTGTASALMAMTPHLLSTGADVPWIPLAITLSAVALVGTLAAAFPVRAAARTSIRENLAAG